MRKLGIAAGFTSLLAFGIYFANVIAGSFYQARFLSDVGEMLMLFAASAMFVVLILVREKLAGTRNPDQP